MTPVRLEPATSRSPVKHSTTEPLRSPNGMTEICKTVTKLRPGHGQLVKMLITIKPDCILGSKFAYLYIWVFSGHCYEKRRWSLAENFDRLPHFSFNCPNLVHNCPQSTFTTGSGHYNPLICLPEYQQYYRDRTWIIVLDIHQPHLVIIQGKQMTAQLQIVSEYDSVGRCVIPWEFLSKSVKHTFSCRKMYPV